MTLRLILSRPLGRTTTTIAGRYQNKLKMRQPEDHTFKPSMVHCLQIQDIEPSSELYSLPRCRVSPILYSALAFAPTAEAPSGWLAVAVFFGLPTALWMYKCLMMVLFQRKIIYMGYIPPGARQERIADHKIPAGLACEEIHIDGDNGAKLHGIFVQPQAFAAGNPKEDPAIIILYLQGNAGTPLARLPIFERLLMGVHISGLGRKHDSTDALKKAAILAVAPRSFWKSEPRRPTEKGITSDYRHVLDYARERFPASTIILYGHSLGGAAAVCLAASLDDSMQYKNVKGMILENPFASIPAMVKALYPQRWLPYHYLGDLAFDRWDALSAMQRAQERDVTLLTRLSRSTLLLLSKKDEIVPHEQGLSLFEAAARQSSAGGDGAQGEPKMVILQSALHENGWTERQWRTEIELFLRSFGSIGF